MDHKCTHDIDLEMMSLLSFTITLSGQDDGDHGRPCPLSPAVHIISSVFL